MRRSEALGWLARAAVALLVAWTGLATAGEPDGRALYRTCATCHGAQGQGVAALKAPAIAGLQAWYVQRQLQGFAAGWRGAAAGDVEGATMRAAAAVLASDRQRAAVAAYVSALAPVNVPAHPPSDAARLVNGRNYYNALCSACHGTNGRGNQQLGAPRLASREAGYLARQFAAFKSGQRGGHPQDRLGAQMRAISAMLPNRDTEQDVIAYASGLQP